MAKNITKKEFEELASKSPRFAEFADRMSRRNKGGAMIVDAKLKEENLILKMTQGKDIDVGRVIGEKGEDGKTPKRGVDYFTKADTEMFVDDIVSAIPEPKEVVVDYDRILKDTVNDLNNSFEISIPGEEIVEELHKLEGDDRLSYKDLKDTPAIFSNGKGGGNNIAYLHELGDVTVTELPANGEVLAWNTATSHWQAKTLEEVVIGGFTAGSALFAGSDGTIDEDNTNFFWDNANNRLGIGDNTPSFNLSLTGNAELSQTFVGGEVGNISLHKNILAAGLEGPFLTYTEGTEFNAVGVGDFTALGGDANNSGFTWRDNATGAENSVSVWNGTTRLKVTDGTDTATADLVLGNGLNIFGESTTSNNYALRVEDSSSNDLFWVRNDGLIQAKRYFVAYEDLNNTFVGLQVKDSITSGSENTMLGDQSGKSITTGDRNTGAGHKSFLQLLGGSDNTAFGENALQAATSALQNTAVGSGAGDLIIDGDDNVFLGYRADGAATGTARAIAIGSAATAVTDSLAIGYSADATVTGNVVFGDVGSPLTNYYFGEGEGSASPTGVTFQPSQAIGTDIAGVNYTIIAGQGTGTGAGGSFIIQTAKAGTTGSSLNSATTRFQIDEDGLIDADSESITAAGSGGVLAQNDFDVPLSVTGTITGSDYVGTGFDLNISGTGTLNGDVTNKNFASALAGTVAYTGTGTLATASGADGAVRNLAAGTITEARGVTGGVINAHPSGTITDAVGLTATIVNAVGTITNAYGIKLSDITAGGSSNYAIHTGTGLVRFGDDVEIDGDLNHDGSNVGFYGTAPIAKPTVTGSRGGNAALADLLTELANLGLITDSSSA